MYISFRDRHLSAVLPHRKMSACASRSWETVTTACLVCPSLYPTTPGTVWRWAWICVRPSSKITDLRLFSLSLSLSLSSSLSHKHKHKQTPVKQFEQKENQTWSQLRPHPRVKTLWMPWAEQTEGRKSASSVRNNTHVRLKGRGEKEVVTC